MDDFKTVDEVVRYLQDHKWRGKDRKEPISKRSVYAHIRQGYLKRAKDGSFCKINVNQYALQYLRDDASLVGKIGLEEQINRERLRKLQIENDKKMGELVPLSEEVKRRVAVLQGMKTAMVNGKATFMRSLRASMKERHPDSPVLNDLLADAAEFYEDAVLDVFDEICNRGRV